MTIPSPRPLPGPTTGDAVVMVDDAGTTILRQRIGFIPTSDHKDVVMQAVGSDDSRWWHPVRLPQHRGRSMAFGEATSAGTPVTFTAYADINDPTLAPYAIERLTTARRWPPNSVRRRRRTRRRRPPPVHHRRHDPRVPELKWRANRDWQAKLQATFVELASIPVDTPDGQREMADAERELVLAYDATVPSATSRMRPSARSTPSTTGSWRWRSL